MAETDGSVNAAAGADVPGGEATVIPEGDQNEVKTSFTLEQQTRVQELIDAAYKRAYANAGKNASDRIVELEEELKGKGTDGKSKADANSVNFDETKKELENLRGQLAQGQAQAVNAALVTAISAHNVANPEALQHVATLLKPQIKVDDNGNLTVQDAEGALVINGEGKAKTVDEFIADFLAKNPHFVGVAGSPGAGSQIAGSGAGGGAGEKKYDLSNPDTWRTMPREDLDQLLKEGINIPGAQGKTFSFKDVKNPFKDARKRHLSGQSGG